MPLKDRYRKTRRRPFPVLHLIFGSVDRFGGVFFLAVACGPALLGSGGCVLSVPGHTPPPTIENGGEQQPTDTSSPSFTVSLSASNSTPQLNEEVLFRCVAGGGFSQPVTFAFQAVDVSLQVAPFGDTASFIVTETELGQGIDVTCTGTDADGNTATSGRTTVFPTG